MGTARRRPEISTPVLSASIFPELREAELAVRRADQHLQSGNGSPLVLWHLHCCSRAVFCGGGALVGRAATARMHKKAVLALFAAYFEERDDRALYHLGNIGPVTERGTG